MVICVCFLVLRKVIKKYHLNELEGIIDSFEDDISRIIVEQQIRDEQNYLNILLHTGGNVIVRTREIMVLIASGYADGALALARTLYEHFIILSFLSLHESDSQFSDYIDDYYLDYERTGNKYFKYLAEHLGYSDLNEKVIAATNNLREHAHHAVNRDYWWTGYGTFSRLVDAVFDEYKDKREKTIFIRMYALYLRACASLHPNSFGITWRLEAGNQYAGINTAPSEKGHILPLELTILCLITIIGIIYDRLEIDGSELIAKLNRLAKLCLEFEKTEDSIL